MNRYSSNKKFIVTIKNKWSNQSRTIVLSSDKDIRELHKYAYYKHTNNLEDIISIQNTGKKNLFTLRSGFRK